MRNTGDKTGLLLVNLGSPDAPTAAAVRPYLGEFLHDPRVIDTTRWIWCPILHGIILRIRPARSAKLYEKIWNLPAEHPAENGQGEAPLIRITRAQAEGLKSRFGDNLEIEVAMRYGNPSMSLGFDRLLGKGCTRIAVLPLYPQYAGASSGSVFDGVFKAIKKRADVPDVRILRDYHDHPKYIAALGESIKTHLAGLDWEPDVIMCSYHGIPKSYVEKGDPYQSECHRTTDLLRDYLGLADDKLIGTFQSRFGPKEWLQPYTDKTLEALPGQGKTKIAVLTPGFAADCLETLEEIAMEGRDSFTEAGGEKFSFIPCLNATETHLDMLETIAREKLLPGWLDRVE